MGIGLVSEKVVFYKLAIIIATDLSLNFECLPQKSAKLPVNMGARVIAQFLLQTVFYLVKTKNLFGCFYFILCFKS